MKRSPGNCFTHFDRYRSMNAFSRSKISTSGIGVLAMHQERHVDLFHALQHAHDFFIVGDAGGRIGRGIGRIKFHAGEQAVAKATLDVVWIGVVGEIAGQERLELRPLRYRRHHPLAIGGAVGRGAHRWNQVRHQDGAAEMFCSVRQHRFEHLAVADVQVPVIGFADGDACCHEIDPMGPSPLTLSLSPLGRGDAASRLP